MTVNAGTWLIWSLEHTAWWRPGRWGYTTVLAEAGRYTRAEAEEIVARANIVAIHECAIPIEAVAVSVRIEGGILQ